MTQLLSPRSDLNCGQHTPADVANPALLNTAVGVLCFSGTLPATRLALESFDASTIAFARGTGAGIIALICLILCRSRLPKRAQVIRLMGASLGMVVVFPIALSAALNYVPATHASVLASLLPLMTALFGVLRGGERAPAGFWISAALGAVLLTLFCAYRTGFSGIDRADPLLLVAFAACSYGYAEGAVLARDLGGWNVICWALTLMLPVEAVGLLTCLLRSGFCHGPLTLRACGGLFYAITISQLIGFFFYYRGLALGGVARMSQMQLFFPFTTILIAHLVLGEKIDLSILLGAGVITLVVLIGKHALAARSA